MISCRYANTLGPLGSHRHVLPALRAGASSSILHGDSPVGNAKAPHAPSSKRALNPKERTSGELSQHRKAGREASTLPKF
jgi:hypothetical protein